MALHLNSSVSELPGIGGKALQDLKNMGICSVYDLLYYVPFRYDDYSNIKTISKIKHGDTITVVATVLSIHSRPVKYRRMTIVEAQIEDDTGEISVVWFNQKYLAETIKPETRLSFSGRVDSNRKLTLVNPVYERAGANIHTGRIVPVYGLTGSLTSKRLRFAIKTALEAVNELEDWLPEKIKNNFDFPNLSTAISWIHFPNTMKELTFAIERLKFDELFLHQLMFARVRDDREKQSACQISINELALKIFVAQLPFELTQAQRKCAWEIIKDLSKEHPMNRLLQGDVGSGKTVVAAIAANCVLENKMTVAYLAPTEILAAQQQDVFAKLLPNHKIALFTRSQKRVGSETIKKDELISLIKNGSINCVVGTHALLQELVEFPQLTFVIIDEQHRFGVAQRHALLEKRKEVSPHLLSMTATPIPRSLSLTVYGDLDISIINQLPKGRKLIGTAIVSKPQRNGMWKHVNEQIERGGQVFVVCPLIDPSDKLGVRSVIEVNDYLKNGPLKNVRIALLHGKLKPDEKQTAIQSFKQGSVDVLVSTTVVEVGVDVPNATIMVIFGAERFGLAQLHQLRGRVGRGNKASYCYLLPEQASGASLERLKALEKTQNGFELAEKDLELRGPGNIFGSAQSGFPDFQFATPADVEIMKKARDSASELLQIDSDLQNHPLLRQKIQSSFDAVHFE